MPVVMDRVNKHALSCQNLRGSLFLVAKAQTFGSF